jgi:hypothetical protein
MSPDHAGSALRTARRNGLTGLAALLFSVTLVTLVVVSAWRGNQDAEHQEAIAATSALFFDYSGARLVFDARLLPSGTYFDRMPSLSADRKLKAALLLLSEVYKLPRGYFGVVGLKTIGVFDSCISLRNDGYHTYDPAVSGYKYYGIWNRENAIACAYYTDGQLPLTFHHESFHHIDATSSGKTDAGRLRQDDRFRAAINGTAAYPPPPITAAELVDLEHRSKSWLLEGAVSAYAEKNPAEDKAESARYLMSHLPDALTQVARRPGLPGSQRLLHVMRRYQQAPPQLGPGINWFVDVALGRAGNLRSGCSEHARH